MKALIILINLTITLNLIAQEKHSIQGPVKYIFDITETDTLKLHVFTPAFRQQGNSHPAIVIFHGGGWSIGDPTWGYWLAEKYAGKGMIAVTAQYRLSDKKHITPIEAMEDARNAILWIRKNSKRLKIQPDSIVAYGWSAGAHLVASAAVFPSFDTDNRLSSIPNALVLYSPALSLASDGWFKTILLDRGNPMNYSPAEHLKGNMPPSIIVVGRDDTVTPIYESELFHKNMQKHGNESYLHIYEGVGHLFTPSDQPDDGWPNPDKEISGRAYEVIDSFLAKLGYIE